jgi:hypothetical protein
MYLEQLYFLKKKIKIVTLFKEMKFFLLFSLLKIRAVTFGIRAMILGQTFLGWERFSMTYAFLDV